MRGRFSINRGLAFLVVFFWAAVLAPDESWAVSSKITRHSTSSDLLKGETVDVVISSKGTIQLGRAAELLTDTDEFEDVWSINSVVVSGSDIFIGTSPNGGIYKYSLGELTKIYPTEAEAQQDSEQKTDVTAEPNETARVGESNDVNEPNDVNAVQAEQYVANEHIFAMATDVAGRLLVGISGDKCQLMRYEGGEMRVIFEPNDAKYIFAIALDEAANIYLGTGPEGKIYKLDSFGKESELIYDSVDKNILSLAISADGFVCAGSDSRGLVYRIDPKAKTATVLYDSDQEEITGLLFTGTGDLYAIATSAKIAKAEAGFAAQLPLAGRPETKKEKTQNADGGQAGLELKIPNTKAAGDEEAAKKQKAGRKLPKSDKVSHVYKISKDGFVTDVFGEMAVFFSLAAQGKELLVGTGNDAELFSIDEATEQEKIVYRDKQASQITAVAVAGDHVFLGTANPAKLIKLGKTFASEGTYASSLVDAGQPAQWGKLQIDADIPEDCLVLVASRSGNVKDINDATFSEWTEPAEVTGPVQLRCPLGRFCQYKLILQTEEGAKSPLIREVAVASTIPNLAPKVESVIVERIEAADKKGVFKISYKAGDDNGDKLIYKIDFRKIPRTGWIELKDKHQADNFEWDGKTVEDGRYEVRIIASDERSNNTATKLTHSRISEAVVVDNTGPEFKSDSITVDKGIVTIKLGISDQLSAIGGLEFTVDSNVDWLGAVPEDLVYDTTEESFTLVTGELAPGGHVIAVKASDAVGNTAYKTFEVTVADN